MFLGEEKGKRVNVTRVEELVATGAQTIGTACPFCQTMFRDALGAMSAIRSRRRSCWTSCRSPPRGISPRNRGDNRPAECYNLFVARCSRRHVFPLDFTTGRVAQLAEQLTLNQ